uniref:Uncharacterized protein n=1 Tax=Anopheles albimanus TaxID=7167 RepID=A0A182F276_ANOAL
MKDESRTGRDATAPPENGSNHHQHQLTERERTSREETSPPASRIALMNSDRESELNSSSLIASWHWLPGTLLVIIVQYGVFRSNVPYLLRARSLQYEI